MTTPKLPRRRAMTPGEVAAAFRVHPKTVIRWADTGLIESFRTPGGHRRFYEDDIRRAFEQGTLS